MSVITVGRAVAVAAMIGGLLLAACTHRPPPPTVPAVADVWAVTALLDVPTGALRPSRTTKFIRLNIVYDGTLAAGVCASAYGSWTATGDHFTADLDRRPDTPCSDPRHAEDETEFFAALERATRWRVEGATLTLADDGGDVLIRATRVLPQDDEG